MRALIDGDVIAYRAGFKAQRKLWVAIYDGEKYTLDSSKKTDLVNHLKVMIPGFDKSKIEWTCTIEVEPEHHAFHTCNLMIKEALLETDSEEFLVVIGNPVRENNFRHQVATIAPYKGNRSSDDAPVLLPRIREFLIERWNARIADGHETDDELMIEHHKDIDNSIICTIDKDFRNGARTLYNIQTKAIITLSAADNLYSFWSQILYGDNTDNVPGLRKWMTPKKFGPKGIEKVMKPLIGCTNPDKYEKHIWEVYKDNHHELGVSYKDLDQKRASYLERLEEIKQLLWIKTK